MERIHCPARLAVHPLPSSRHTGSSSRMSLFYRCHSQTLAISHPVTSALRILLSFCMLPSWCPQLTWHVSFPVVFYRVLRTHHRETLLPVLLDLAGHTVFRGRSNLWFMSITAPGRMGHPCNFLQIYQYSGKDSSRTIFLLNFKLIFNPRGCLFS